MKTTILAAAVASLVAAAPIQAQWAPSPRGAGMAGAGFVFASGNEAVEWNPANLAAHGGWSLTLLDLGSSGQITGTTLGDLYDIATAAGDGDPGLVNRLPAAGLSVFASMEGFALSQGTQLADLPSVRADVPTLGISYGPVGLRVRSQVFGEVVISRELADLTVLGYNPERLTEYAVGSTGFRLTSFTEFTLAAGHSIDRFHVGVGARMVRGHQLVQGRLFEPDIDLTDETMTVDGVAVEAPGGTGWGVDLGIAIDLGAGFRWSMAGRNIFQRMTWEDELRTHQAAFSDSDFDDADFEEILDRFEETELDAQAVDLLVYEAARGLFTQSYFPAIARMGVGWSKNSTRIELVGTAVSPQGRQHAQWEERASIGIEQGLSILTLRAGYTLARDGLRAWAGGLGLRVGPVHLDVGAGMLSGSHLGSEYSGVQGSIGLSVRGGGA